MPGQGSGVGSWDVCQGGRDVQESLPALLPSALSCPRTTETVTTIRTDEVSRESQTGAAGKGLRYCKTTVTEIAGFVPLAFRFSLFLLLPQSTTGQRRQFSCSYGPSLWK